MLSTQSGMQRSRLPGSRANQTHETEQPHKQRPLHMPCGNSLDIHRGQGALVARPLARMPAQAPGAVSLDAAQTTA